MTHAERPVSRLLAIGAIVLFGAMAAIEFWRYADEVGLGTSDFFGIWSWSRFLALDGTASLYDPAAMHRFQEAIDPAYADEYYPFLYPPTYLLLIWPLAHLKLGAARALWSAATLSAYLAALCAPRWRPMLGAAAIVAPATVMCLLCGQNGLLTAALMLGGLRCAASRPLLGGALLGLLTYKPHLAALVPVALIAAGLWSAVLAAALSATAAVVASLLAFGTQPWASWLAAQRESWATIDAFIGARVHMIPTVSAALRQLGFAAEAVWVGQVAAALVGAAATWLVWRRGSDTQRLLVVPVAALLATPYAFLYDLPMLSGAALLALAGAVPPLGAAFLGSALLLPQLMFDLQATPVPLAAPMLALLLVWLLLLQTGDRLRRREPGSGVLLTES